MRRVQDIMRINEMDLERLGFTKIVVSPEESGDATGYYYYEYALSDMNSDFCLISIDSEKVTNDEWKVQLFETPDFEFTDRFLLRSFIEQIISYKKHQLHE